MYIHLGGSVVVKNKEIIACFDIDKTTVSKVTRKFLREAQDKGKIVNINVNDLPKSFIVTEKKEGIVIYLSNLTVQTIMKRNKI